ncbi:MAG: transglycosylase domain-containing protein [Eubacteriales bacterium SKADARSKE-1]|nr:transglycosylase domain-containing protein [Eubacteriales bacterium SKADARSKE-1]
MKKQFNKTSKRKFELFFSEDETKKSLFKKILKTFLTILLVVSTFVTATIFIYIFTIANDKIPYDMKATKLHLTSIVYVNDESGKPVEYTKAYDSENRIWVDFKEIPQHMKDAIVAIEDKRFFDHAGVDWIRTGGAILHFLSGNSSYGGSTLTQQLIKNLTEENDVSITRKIKEIFRALNFEKEYSKDEILEAYLNIVNFGGGCHGVQSAANLYFNKNISDCSIAECATIAGITQNPSAFNPFLHPENNKIRRETVIEEMKAQSKITETEYNEAMKESSSMEFKHSVSGINNSSTPVRDWYTEALFNDITNDLAENLKIGKSSAQKMLFTQGLQIYSAMDKKAQSIAESVIVDSNLLASDKKLEVGFLMMDLEGRILASVGAREKKTANSLFDRANFAKRQPGSSIKPLSVYAPSIDLGLYNYSSLVSDSPLPNFYGVGKPGPRNWYSGYKGNVTLQWAIEQSANAPVVQVLQKLTNRKSYDFLIKKLGFKNIDDVDLVSASGLGLGGLHTGVTVREMTAGFQIFGNGGIYNKPYTYYYVLDRNGKILLDNRNNTGKRAISSKTATIMNRLLKQVINQGTGKAASIPDQDVIGKTGTTNKKKDIWFIGETPYAVAGVWTGYNLPKSLSATVYAKQIWKDVMTKYLAGKPAKNYQLDKDVLELPYCKNTGKLAIPGVCPNTAIGYYSNDNMPEICNEHFSGQMQNRTIDDALQPGAYGEE